MSRFLNGPDCSTPRLSETLGRKETRLNQTIYAEYADVKQWLEELRGAKATQDDQSLEELWDVNKEETSERISRLVEIGFFKRKNERGRYVYWVSFLYRPGLEMVQGSA